jgi:hypothetical protein
MCRDFLIQAFILSNETLFVAPTSMIIIENNIYHDPFLSLVKKSDNVLHDIKL